MHSPRLRWPTTYHHGLFNRIIARWEDDSASADVAVSGSFSRSAFELRSEWIRLGHTSIATGKKYDTTGWYTLGAREINRRVKCQLTGVRMIQ